MQNKLNKILAGGASFLALAALFMPVTATAADTGYDLYYFDGDSIVRVTEGDKFTTVGSDTYRNTTCVTRADGNPYTLSINRYTKKPELSLTSGYCKPATNDHAIPGHSARGSANVAPLQSSTAPSPRYMSVDGEGYVWISTGITSTNGGGSLTSSVVVISAPTIVQETKNIEFQAIASSTDTRTSYSDGQVLLLGSPRTTQQTAAVQLPQSGDPAASVWQSLPYLAALASVGAAATVLAVAKKRS